MKNGFVQYAMAGILLASVSLNVRAWFEPRPQEQPRAHAVVDLDELGLSEDQLEALTVCCGTVCVDETELNQSVDAALDALAAALQDRSTPEEEIERLTAELSERRSLALRNRVRSILIVRDVLDGPQLEELVNCCTGQAGACVECPE